MKKVFLLVTLLVPAMVSAGILEWGMEDVPKGKVKTVKCYLISLGDSAKCCSDPERTLYFDTAGRKIAEDVVIMTSKSNISYEYDNLSRLRKKTSSSWDTHYYYNDSGNNKQLVMTIRYPHGSTHFMEKVLYSYEGDKLIQLKSYSEYSELYTCTVSIDANGAKTEAYYKDGKLTERDETRYLADGSIAMMNHTTDHKDDEQKFYHIEQYNYDRYDAQGNWVKCRVIGNFYGKPMYWLFVREIEYY